MAYRNIGWAFSLVALSIACNQAANYESTYKKEEKAATEESTVGSSVASADSSDHGAMPDGQTQIPAPPAMPAPPAPPPAPPAPGAPPPLATPNAASFEKMVQNQQLYTVTQITTGQGWGSSAAAPLTVTAFVDNAGALPAPPSRTQLFTRMTREQLARIDYNNPPKLELVDLQGQVVNLASMTSLWIVCNNVQGDNIYMHSGVNAGPFNHGNSAIPATETVAGVQQAGRCAAFPVASLNANTGGTYDHNDGNNPANFIHLRIQKVNAAGQVVP